LTLHILIQHQPNGFDLGLNLVDDETLETFDFDSFLQTGENNKPIPGDLVSDFDFTHPAKV